MTLILGNDNIDAVLDMPTCLAALESAYEAAARGEALNRPRTDMYTGHELDGAVYAFKTFEGLVPHDGVAALRLCSDVIRWEDYAGGIRKEKVPYAEGRWVGMVLLFSTSTGEPLAILQDGVMGRMRVGAANGLAARYMARPEAKAYGLLGAGWQAGAQLMAMAAVRDFDHVRVFSPNPERRRAFAEEYSDRLGLRIDAVDGAEDAVRDADIVGCATNAVSSLVDPSWLEPGQHLTCIKRTELGEEVLGKCERVVVHTRNSRPINYLSGLGSVEVQTHDPIDIALRLKAGEQIDEKEIQRLNAEAQSSDPDLCDLISGKIKGRGGPNEINAFDNNIGLGIQFATLAKLAYERALQDGRGKEVPTSWFTEDVHN